MEYVKGEWKVRVNRDDTKVYPAIYTEILHSDAGVLVIASVSGIKSEEPYDLNEVELIDKDNEVHWYQKMPSETKLKVVPGRILHIDFKLNALQLKGDNNEE